MPVFTQRVCPDRRACAFCRRDDAEGERWRVAVSKTFAVPAAAPEEPPQRFACPFGVKWNTTAEQAKPARITPPNKGVGAEIAKLITSWGIKDDGCGSCHALAATWDRNGIEWCEQHAGELASVLTQRAKAKGWLLGVGAMLAAPALVAKAIANAKASRDESASP